MKNSVAIKKEKEKPRPPLSLSKPVPDDMTCFCAAVIFRISGQGTLQFAYVSYRRNGAGALQTKLAGGMGKKIESPLGTVKREIREEAGVEIEEKDFQFCFSTSPLSDPKHIKLFFMVTREIKESLRDTPCDNETGKPEWALAEWLAENLFGVHKEVFPKAIDILLEYFIERKNLEGLLAAVKSGLLNPDDKIKELILERALSDSKFALAHAGELEDLGIGCGEYCF